ncbi:2-keto-4-pentenoate hydratase [Acuticoccus sediminis]|uniref:2-keto-4-pentenoate hydratase n=1 Tax=Acuticoccus sediminis TaxID=2184697 RepID=A0A8B2NVP9_9HYPH|nr:2-keto-4-pentenoate hydratase [Acuticoccus sediminis]RAI02398.1 2-keto-4-pentenoate hydratase [Acuticoccus sediminis]
MPTPLAERFAATLIEAHRTNSRAPASAAAEFSASATGADVTDVQALVADELGPVTAWKTAPGADKPMIAPILGRRVKPSGATFGTDEIGACGIELEIAFRLDAPLPPLDAPDFAARLREVVTPIVTIEVVDGRVEDFVDAPAPAKLADNQNNGGLVLGGTGTIVGTSPAVRLAFDGKVVVEGPATPPGGDAWAALERFVLHVGSLCGGFQVGQVLTTGSLTGMPFIEPGTRVEGEVEGLGSVTLDYAAR